MSPKRCDEKGFMHKRTTSRAAISAAAVVAGVIIAGALVAGIFFSFSYSPDTATSQSLSNSEGSSTTTNTVMLTSNSESSSSPVGTGSSISSSSVNTTTTVITNAYTTTLPGPVGSNFSYAEVAFGGGNTPSGIFIPANTMTWATFIYGANMSSILEAQIQVWGYSHEDGTSVEVGIYNTYGNLVTSAANSIPGPSSGNISANFTANQVIAFPSNTPQINLGVQIDQASISKGSEFTVAFVANHSLWIEGWTNQDRAVSGYQPAPWEIPITYETAVAQYSALPSALPQPSLQSSFEIAIVGNADWNIEGS